MRVIGVMLLALSFALAGCSDSDDGNGDGDDSMPNGAGDPNVGGESGGQVDNDTEGGTENDDLGPKRSAVTWDISIQGVDFVDGSLTIQVGDTVRWTHNDGTTPHSVTSTDGQTESFDSSPSNCMSPVFVGCMVAGDTFSWTFDAVGSTDYFCKIHADMTGTITVMDRYDATPA